MISNKWLNFIVGGFTAILFMACGSKMAIERVNYSQSLETVVQPSETGAVDDIKHGLSFNIKPIQYKETRDTSSVTTDKVHLIRNAKGFYFVTAPGYNNVYVMRPETGKLNLHKTIHISDNGIGKPAFNQRDPHIQLINQETDETYRLTEEGTQQ
jgi:hypothetical protein